MSGVILALEGKGSLPSGFSGVVLSSSATGTFTPKVAWNGTGLPEDSTALLSLVAGLQDAYSGTDASDISQISSLLAATGSASLIYGNGMLTTALGGNAVAVSSV